MKPPARQAAKRLTAADKLAVLVLMSAAIGGILAQILMPSGEQRLEIRRDGKQIYSHVMRDGYKQQIDCSVDGHINIVEIDGKKVRMQDANCHDRACVRTGWLDAPPRQIVCLPHRLVVSIVKDDEQELDGIVK